MEQKQSAQLKNIGLKRSTKDAEGITLLALVITVIILLILARSCN